MAIEFRAFNFWTHVSAKATNKNHLIYLSRGSRQNDLLIDELFDTYVKGHNNIDIMYCPSEGYDLALMSSLPSSGLPERNKIYLSENGKCVIRGLGGVYHAQFNKSFDLRDLENKLNDQQFKDKILKVISEQLKLPYKNKCKLRITIGEDTIYLFTKIVNHGSAYTLSRDDLNVKINRLKLDSENKKNLINFLCCIRFKNNKVFYKDLLEMESEKKDDIITLFSQEDGYYYGVSEAQFHKNVCNDVSDYHIFNNNCADSVITALEASLDNHAKKNLPSEKTFINLGVIKIRNPNIWILGTTAVDYSRTVRDKILHNTINDPDKKLDVTEKTIQVLNMEIQRLKDGARNLKQNSIFCIFRKNSIREKINKMKELQNALSNITNNTKKSENNTKNEIYKLLKNPIIDHGYTRRKTHHTLSLLYNSYSSKSLPLGKTKGRR